MDTTEEHVNKLEDQTDYLTLKEAQQNEWVGSMKQKSRLEWKSQKVLHPSNGSLKERRERKRTEKKNKSNDRRTFPKTSKDVSLQI